MRSRSRQAVSDPGSHIMGLADFPRPPYLSLPPLSPCSHNLVCSPSVDPPSCRPRAACTSLACWVTATLRTMVLCASLLLSFPTLPRPEPSVCHSQRRNRWSRSRRPSLRVEQPDGLCDRGRRHGLRRHGSSEEPALFCAAIHSSASKSSLIGQLFLQINIPGYSYLNGLTGKAQDWAYKTTPQNDAVCPL